MGLNGPELAKLLKARINSIPTRTPWAFGAQGGGGWVCLAEEYLIVLQHTRLEPTRLYWIAPSESVEDIEEGKNRAAAHALAYLRRVANSELPRLQWKKSRSV